MLFWSLAALLLLFVVLVLAWPLLRPAGRKPAEDDYSLNLGVYKDQLQELATQQEDGLLTEEQAEQVRQDIERSLLQEVLKEGAEPSPCPCTCIWAVPVRQLITAPPPPPSMKWYTGWNSACRPTRTTWMAG
jgi:cytochrome c-type biogenesis protein CcmI